MIMDTMFDTLLQLPLFQGLAQEDFTNILAKVKLHFTKYKGGELIAGKDSLCDRLTFMLQGVISATTLSADSSYAFTEYYTAPYLIEPQSLFGMKTCYAATYASEGESNAISIDKPFMMRELFKYDIFRMNYMNIVSNRVQVLHGNLWAGCADGLEERISAFIMSRAERPNGMKMLKIKMEELARILNDTRANISKTLNAMQDKGLLELHRGEILIPRIEKLTAYDLIPTAP